MAARAYIDDLVDGLNEAEGRVEAAATDGTSGVDHSEKSESDSCCLKDAIFTFLSAVIDLTDDTLAEEESAPEL